jgi:hypothetical protein
MEPKSPAQKAWETMRNNPPDKKLQQQKNPESCKNNRRECKK